MEQGEKPKIRKPRKVYIRLDQQYEGTAFIGSAYDAPQEGMDKDNTVEYLAKPALLSGLVNLLPQFEKAAHRNDATPILRKKVRDQKAAVQEIIKMIGNL